MDNMSTSFRIAVNANQEIIIEILRRHFKQLGPIRNNKFVLNDNHVVISKNDDFNEELAVIDEDSFLYYESNVDFFPSNDDQSLENQIILAKEIHLVFIQENILAEIISEFENLL